LNELISKDGGNLLQKFNFFFLTKDEFNMNFKDFCT
jgi:hypothetical protein